VVTGELELPRREMDCGRRRVTTGFFKWWPQRDTIELTEFKYAISLRVDHSQFPGGPGTRRRRSSVVAELRGWIC